MNTEKKPVISPATDQVAIQAHDAVNRIAEAVAKAETQLRSVTADAEKNLRERTGTIKQQADTKFKELDAYAKKKPIATAGIALAVGFVLGKILSR